MNFFKTCNYPGLAIACLNLAIIGGLIGMNVHSTKNTEEPEIITAHLNEIQGQLTTLQQETKKPAQQIDLSAIQQEFNNLTTMIEQLKSKDENQLNQLITEHSNELTHKLDAIHEVINTMDKKQNPIKLLPVTALPFKALSIDSIQQVNVASVGYDFKTIPLEKGDTFINWTVLKIDFGKQHIEFENKNKERVVINLEQEQADEHA
jgi:hypothetical protein